MLLHNNADKVLVWRLVAFVLNEQFLDDWNFEQEVVIKFHDLSAVLLAAFITHDSTYGFIVNKKQIAFTVW